MAANRTGATIPHDERGFGSSGNKKHMTLTTVNDDKQVRINSRPYNQATGDSIGFQAKPSQETTTTGAVVGGEVSPRVQSGIGFGSIKGLHVDCDLKAAAGGNGTNVYVTEFEAVSPAGSTRTISGDVAFIRIRSGMESGITISGDNVPILVAANEGKAWSAFAKFPDDAGVAAGTGSPASLPANTAYVRVKIGSTFFKLAGYAN